MGSIQPNSQAFEGAIHRPPQQGQGSIVVNRCLNQAGVAHDPLLVVHDVGGRALSQANGAPAIAPESPDRGKTSRSTRLDSSERCRPRHRDEDVPVYEAGPFHLQRFITGLSPSEENHMGEAILRGDGTVEYLKTYRLSAAQTRRAYLLKQLAQGGWSLERTAEHLKTTQDELIVRLRNAGFGYQLKEHVLKAAEARLARR
ncbi:hypothetical protein COCOR_06844 [Corallococcus coralloides DSM 2259]|uniref:Uncharacterized protein n=2 Tax=Corallococcus coralloides TaxID=184914 RepID=H8N0Y9_CORCM|nr:hypothetical protein COCOR_06844 [Corallococcus coralloides DSM 2259]